MESSIIPKYVQSGAIGFLAGVAIHAASPFEPMSIWVPVIGALGGMIFRHKWILFAGIMFALGFFRFESTLPAPDDYLARLQGSTATFEGRIREARNYDAIVEVPGSASHISIPSTNRFRVGEHVRVTCRIEQNEKSDPAYETYDARKGIFFRCRGTTTAQSISRASTWDVMAMLAEWRVVMSRRIRLILPGDEGALLAGILYGERSLSNETSDRFRRAGMTHLIAVSGSNITLVVSLFVPLLIAIGYRRRSAIFLSGFGILLFTLFVGAEASVVRAAIMGWLALNARFVGRKANATHLLLLAGAVMILFDPWALAFDAGFALSFLATWGLLAWSRPIAEHIKWIPETFGLREIISTTTAATYVTTPYLLWAFESSSLAGLITNLFAIPLVGLAMGLGALALLVGPYMPFSILPAEGALAAMLLCARIADLVPWLQFGLQLPTWGLFLAYALMCAHWRLRLAKNRHYPQESWDCRDFEGVSKAFVRPF